MFNDMAVRVDGFSAGLHGLAWIERQERTVISSGSLTIRFWTFPRRDLGSDNAFGG